MTVIVVSCVQIKPAAMTADVWRLVAAWWQVSEESRQLSELVSEVESQLPADTAVTIPAQLHDIRLLLTKLSARLLEGQARHERLTRHGQSNQAGRPGRCHPVTQLIAGLGWSDGEIGCTICANSVSCTMLAVMRPHQPVACRGTGRCMSASDSYVRRVRLHCSHVLSSVADSATGCTYTA